MLDIMSNLRGLVGSTFVGLCSVLPIQKKVVFSSYEGSFFNDSPQVLFETMKDKMGEYDFVWLMKDESKIIPGAKTVKARSFKALYHLATSKIWIDNCRKSAWLKKRKGQYYVQTWHGGFALKRIEADVADKLSAGYVECAKNDSKLADVFLSGSKWASQNYRTSFWYDGEILEYGLPRADMFYKESKPYVDNVYEFYNLDKETRLALYAPTFRVDENMKCYSIDFEQLVKQLEETWGGKWKILIRLHPNIVKKQNFINYNEQILNGSMFNDINELIIASELLITDYSSCMFDAMEAHKKVMLYASDIADYMKDRGTYFSFEELPFLLAENNEELLGNVKQFNIQKYEEKTKTFMNEHGFLNCADSSEKIVTYILKHIS